MCDFAGDAEAARQLLVGRVLTVERVRELNAGEADVARLTMWLD